MLNQGGNYLKTENVKDGDLITFKDEGSWVESAKYTYDDGNPKQDFVMKVEHKGKEYSLRVNKFSRDELVPVYGTDTKGWIGKQAKVAIENYRSLGKKGIILTAPSKEESQVEEPTEWEDNR